MPGYELDLPVIKVVADNLPRAWERAVVRTWKKGAMIATQYDKIGDPPSRDALAMIVVTDPLSEPRIHRAFPGGITELEAYRQEVVDGIHDHWVDPEAGKWEYTYHQRFCGYDALKFVPDHPMGCEFEPASYQPYKINQLDYIVDALAAAPHTRRAQAITWMPGKDAGISDPPCLQRIWCRIFDDRLVMNINIRSNDAFKAGFMNMYAFTDLQRVIAERVSDVIGRPIEVGQYTHIADSFHIYGSYFDEFRGFLRTLRKRTFEERTFRTEEVQEIIDEARVQIRESIGREKLTGRKGL